jgi:pyruvate kinase
MDDLSPLRQLSVEIDELATLLAAEGQLEDVVCAAVAPEHVASMRNLNQYLALRHGDVRDLQWRLHQQGLSSLGRCESSVQATVEAVRRALCALSGEPYSARVVPVGIDEGRRRLHERTDMVLGTAAPGRSTRIMVTLPSEAADDPGVIDELIANGTDLVRVNSAHDDASAWLRMFEHVRLAEQRHRTQCRILFDLGGPKLRTGAFADGPQVLKLRPARDPFGTVVETGHALLVREGCEAPDEGSPGLAVVTVRLEPGVVTLTGPLAMVDSRGSRRVLDVVRSSADAWTVATSRTTYLIPGAELVADGVTVARIVDMPCMTPALTLHTGDLLAMDADPTPAAVVDRRLDDWRPRIGCTLPEAIAAIERGHRVFLDDGKIAGVVEDVQSGTAFVRITRARDGGTRLKAEKGVNLPDTDIPVPALTATDRAALAAVAPHIDLVGLSFVRTPRDIEDLHRALDEHAPARGLLGPTGTVLKIETVQGFRNLPDLLRTAMARPSVAVMIARGDLAVEAGYERLAEVQEEILWLCEAAHVPVIWATQVLDTLARTGQPSRSEISDAAMSGRAECVMLNKGPHIVAAVSTLDDILRRMSDHQDKKLTLLRQLQSWAPAPIANSVVGEPWDRLRPAAV